MTFRSFIRETCNRIIIRFSDINMAKIPFGYRGVEPSYITDGIEYKFSEIKVIEMFSQISSDRQVCTYNFLQHSYSGELAALFDRYGSDKGTLDVENSSVKSYPWRIHTYAHFYELMFKPIRETTKLVFECGIGNLSNEYRANMDTNVKSGASLRAWRDYFPNARILGADIDSSLLFSEERITTTYVDQTSRDSINEMWRNFDINGEVDIIIDDGLHNFIGGSTLFDCSFKHLRTGGIYIIEDVTSNFLSEYDEFFARLGISYLITATPINNELGDNIFMTIVK